MCMRTWPVSGDQSARGAASPDAHSSALSAATRTFAVWIVRSAQRKALRELAQERRFLNDIGLSREEVAREVAKPFWRS